MRLFISVASDWAHISALVWNDWSPSIFRFRTGPGTLSSAHVSRLAVGWWRWLLISWVLTRIFAFGVLVLLYLIGCVCWANRSSTLCSLDGNTRCRWGLLSVGGSGTLLGPMWSRISSHFRLAVVVSSSWKCSRNRSSAIARGIDAPESTIIVLDPGMVSRLGGLSDVVCVRFSGWAPFDFRVARAAFVQTLWNYCRD